MSDPHEALRRALEASPNGSLDLSDPENRSLVSAVEESDRLYLEGLKRAALAKQDWLEYLRMFGSHEARDALFGIADDIDDADTFWQCVADTWTRDDAPGMDEAGWRFVFNDVWPRMTRQQLMTDTEHSALESLSEPIPVFRGFTREGGERGFAWTLDRGRAEWFARNYHAGPRLQMLHGAEAGGNPRIASGTVAKEKVIAHFLERKEAEIVVLPEDVNVLSIEAVGQGAI